MIDIDFRLIAPRCGGQREAFEELCCQLARRTIISDATFIRLHGAGGDGGVECFADLPAGNRIGWQAKYVFDIGSLLTQASRSLSTALDIHPTLTRYIVCFPNEFYSDFFKYSMGCLHPWVHAFPKKDMGAWILQRIVRDFGYESSGCEKYDGYMLGKHGGGRGKLKWAERIGKKYQWIGMYHLASRLHDHIKREQDSWEPAPLRTPFILLEERKLDPTLPCRFIGSDRNSDAWWIGDSTNLQIGEQLSDRDWVNLVGDLPSLERLLSTKECDDQRWLLLVSYPAWSDRTEDADWNQQYRYVWIHIESHLVAKDDINFGYDCLHRRNFFGQWMKQGASWLYGFAGEYPWASPFNLQSDEWHSSGGFGHSLPVT